MQRFDDQAEKGNDNPVRSTLILAGGDFRAVYPAVPAPGTVVLPRLRGFVYLSGFISSSLYL